MKNPLDTVKGTIVAGVLITVVLVVAIRLVA